MNKQPNFICQYCGKATFVKPSALKAKKYCSKTCHDNAQKKGEQRACARCGKVRWFSPSEIRPRNFCSKECQTEWLREFTINELNVPGHSAGHKAQHLTKLNRERNPKIAVEQDPAKRGNYKRGKTTGHREIMEAHLGRKLEPWEDVHHINGKHDDNRIENLQVIPHEEHLRLHWKLAKEKGVI